MVRNRHNVIGIFTTPGGVIRALGMVQGAGLGRGTVYSPFQDRNLEAGASGSEGYISSLALLGGIAGAATGLVLTVGTSVELSLTTGGQPIISLPPFLVIIFELTILFGVLGTVLGLIWSIRRGRSKEAHYDPRFSSDRFGLRVECDDDRAAAVRELMITAGAEEARDEKF